jgi:hypothetical protein
MTTEDVVSAHTSAKTQVRRGVRIGAVAVVATLALSACSGQSGYVDGWWGNGDPIYAPFKADLFDEEGVPVCTTPTAGANFESRARAYSETGGLANLFLFEVMNDEPDPDEPLTGLTETEERNERTRRERLQNSLDTMYQMTHPRFDEANGISEADDLGGIKDELQSHLEGLGVDAPIYTYLTRAERWLETEDSRLSINRIPNVEEYIELNNIPHVFQGLAFSYDRATDRDGDEYLLVTDRETGEAVLMTSDEEVPLNEEAELFEQFEIDLTLTGGEPHATVTLVNDQCPAYFGSPTSRFWIFDFELLFPEEPEAIILE